MNLTGMLSEQKVEFLNFVKDKLNRHDAGAGEPQLFVDSHRYPDERSRKLGLQLMGGVVGGLPSDHSRPQPIRQSRIFV